MDKRKCANCGGDIDLDDKSSFKTCMHNQIHRYVCDSKCMKEFYGCKQNPNGAANNQFDGLTRRITASCGRSTKPPERSKCDGNNPSDT